MRRKDNDSAPHEGTVLTALAESYFRSQEKEIGSSDLARKLVIAAFEAGYVAHQHGKHVVIGTTDGDCDQALGRDCVSWVHGTFASNEEGKKYADAMPEGFNAHIMRVQEPFTLRSESTPQSPQQDTPHTLWSQVVAERDAARAAQGLPGLADIAGDEWSSGTSRTPGQDSPGQ